MAGTFNFDLYSFDVSTTRSLINDTDWVVFTLLVNPQGGRGTPQTKLKLMGAVGNGTHNVELSFQNVVVNPTDTVLLNYIILNCENFIQDGSLVLDTMASVSQMLTSMGAAPNPPGPDRPIPQLSSALQVLGGWLNGEFYNVTKGDDPGGNPIGFAGCDGPVAVEQSTFTYSDLLARTSTHTFTQNTSHPGIHSGATCGADSMYGVTYQVTHPTRTVPNVIGMSVKQAELTLTLVQLVWSLVRGSKTGLVTEQSVKPGTVVNAGTTVMLTLDNNR